MPLYEKIIGYLEKPVSIAPLATFRMAFGLVMLFGTIRYVALGWVNSQLVNPVLHFHYFGFEWVEPLPGNGMYFVFCAMIVSCIGITLGYFYRWAAFLFFICFTYVELIDITYYLNHYYFVSIISFLLILVPANRYFSLDVARKPSLLRRQISLWQVGVFKLQIGIVYGYAGLAKANYDWLIKALPLSIWLPAKTSMPIIGPIFKYKMAAYLSSWLGMLFDTFIIGGLLWKKTRWPAYLAVVVFHTLTGILFQIGIFPIVMIFVVTIFFSDDFHEKLIRRTSSLLGKGKKARSSSVAAKKQPLRTSSYAYIFLFIFFAFQMLFPWRYLLYDGNVFWTEQGYRFAWRVMLMEKAGTATFYVKDGESGREGSVINHQFLNPHQEKQMTMQPDLILQFARYLESYYKAQGMVEPQVRAEVLVTLNARPSKYLIDPNTILSKEKEGWKPKDWILPYTH